VNLDKDDVLAVSHGSFETVKAKHFLKKKVVAIALISFIAVSSALGQFAVIDAAHIIESVANGKTLINQMSQLVTTYNRITQQYNQAVYMAQYLRNTANYRVTMTNWQGTLASNASGTTGGWLGAVNSGLNVSGGWLNSTYGRPSFATLGRVLSAPQRAQAQLEYGTFELEDGTAQSAMQTVGSLRLHGTQSEAALNSLERDSMAADPDQNTTAALLNKINAAGMVNARQTADTNKALVSLTEMQLIQMKARHDAEAAAVEHEIAFRTTGYDLLEQQHRGLSQAMRNFQFQ